MVIVGLEIEHVGVGQKMRQTIGDGLAVFFVDANVDLHAHS
jgi:hypothetical protein